MTDKCFRVLIHGAWWGGWEDGRKKDTAVSAMAVAGCHAIDAMRWFSAPGEFEAAEPVEVFAYAGGKRKGKTLQYNPTINDWQTHEIVFAAQQCYRDRRPVPLPLLT